MDSTPIYFLAASIILSTIAQLGIYLYERSRITYPLLQLAKDQRAAITEIQRLNDYLLNTVTANTGALVENKKMIERQGEIIENCPARKGDALCQGKG